MSSDRETLDFYDASAADYAALKIGDEHLATLERFVAALPKGGSALDLGCGHGWAAALMAERGLMVDATDGSAGMVEAARQAGVDARVMRFDELEAVDAYDGVWASFSLLHAPLADAPALLARVHRSMKTGGALFVGVKAVATGPSIERRDSLGRFYADYSREDLERALTEAGFAVEWTGDGGGIGMDGQPSLHLYMLARRVG